MRKWLLTTGISLIGVLAVFCLKKKRPTQVELPRGDETRMDVIDDPLLVTDEDRRLAAVIMANTGSDKIPYMPPEFPADTKWHATLGPFD